MLLESPALGLPALGLPVLEPTVLSHDPNGVIGQRGCLRSWRTGIRLVARTRHTSVPKPPRRQRPFAPRRRQLILTTSAIKWLYIGLSLDSS